MGDDRYKWEVWQYASAHKRHLYTRHGASQALAILDYLYREECDQYQWHARITPSASVEGERVRWFKSVRAARRWAEGVIVEAVLGR